MRNQTMRKLSYRLIRKGMLLAGLALPVLASTAAHAQTDAPSLRDVEARWDLLNEYCVGCHNVEDWAGSLAFDTLSPASVAENAAIFEEAIRKMRGRLNRFDPSRPETPWRVPCPAPHPDADGRSCGWKRMSCSAPCGS